MGSFLGDALGGPIEFQDLKDLERLPDPPHRWREDETLTSGALRATRSRLTLRGYDPLRPEPELYGQWRHHAPPGTVTDDSRHKMILLTALHRAVSAGERLEARGLARGYLDWPRTPLIEGDKETRKLAEEWLREWNLASRWVLGERDPALARPPERLWGGLATCCGQMTLLPMAALHPGNPEEAYLHAYELAYFDNGPARDLNAALVAGLAHLLAPEPAPRGDRSLWAALIGAMRSVDPFRYGQVPWVRRPVDQWLDFVEETVAAADGHPGRVFAAFDRAFADAIKWEAHVCFSVALAALRLAGDDPLAALQLSLEWGHDTDSYAQLVGAMVGARHGREVFPVEMREVVAIRVLEDYGFNLSTEGEWLADRAE